MKALVSVCIPTYNGADFLRPCLESALAQTHGNLEILVVDDGSTDETQAIAESYAKLDRRVKLHVADKNVGLVANWNRCLELASGKWIKFLFQDDLLKPECVDELLALAVSSGCELVACDREFLFEPGINEPSERYYRRHRQMVKDELMAGGGATTAQLIERLMRLERLAFNVLGEPSASLFSSELTRRIGPFDAALQVLCDAEYWVRGSQWTSVAFHDEPLASFRVHANAASQRMLRASRDVCFVLDPFVLEHLYLTSPRFERFRACIDSDRLTRLRRDHFELAARVFQMAHQRDAAGDNALAEALSLAEERVPGLVDAAGKPDSELGAGPAAQFPSYHSSLSAKALQANTASEHELLKQCVRPISRIDAAHISHLLQRDLDWTLIVRTALTHGVSPLLARTLESIAPALLPPEIRAALSTHLQDNRDRNLVLARGLLGILDALGKAGIVALPFKGQTLGILAYGDYSLRRAGDVDLLLRREELREACEILEELGFTELTSSEIGRPMSAVEHDGYLSYQCEYAYYRAGDAMTVEPHWALAPKTLSINFDLEPLWGRTETVSLLDQRVPTVGVADLLPLLCIHASKHEWTRLQWICDVGWLLESHSNLSLEPIIRAAAKRGLERVVLVGLGLADAVLGAPLPPSVRARIASNAATLRLIDRFQARLFDVGLETSPLYEVSSLRLALRERARDRAAYVFRTIVTPTEKHFRLVPLPRSLRCLCTPLKLGHDYLALPLWQAAGIGRRRR